MTFLDGVMLELLNLRDGHGEAIDGLLKLDVGCNLVSLLQLLLTKLLDFLLELACGFLKNV